MSNFLNPKITDVVDLGNIDKRWNGFYGKFINLGDFENSESPYIYIETGETNNPAIRYNKTNSKWEFTNDGSVWMGVGGDDWENIINKPSSTTSQIDQAVNNSHEHTNKTILDNIQEALTTELKNTYDLKEDSSNKGIADGYASLDSDGKIPLSQIPTINAVSKIVNTIAERDLLEDLEYGFRVFVIDASEDTTVNSGSAEYIYDGTVWIKISETEAMEIVLSWENLQNKPTSTVSQIDQAVNNSHTHPNELLEKPTVDGTEGQVLTSNSDGTYAWADSQAGGLETTYTNLNPTPNTVGGIKYGSTFDNISFSEMFTKLLYPYQVPEISNFTLSGINNTLEVGQSIAAEKTFTWNSTNSENLKENSISIIKSSDSTVLGSNLENTGTFTTTTEEITNNTASTLNYELQYEDTQDKSYSTTLSVYWKFKSFVLSISDASLTAELLSSSVKQFDNFQASVYNVSFTSSYPGYKYFVVPETQTLSSFTDTSTQMNVPFEEAVTLSVTNSYDITSNYNVYRSTNILNGDITIRAN